MSSEYYLNKETEINFIYGDNKNCVSCINRQNTSYKELRFYLISIRRLQRRRNVLRGPRQIFSWGSKNFFFWQCPENKFFLVNLF